MKEDHIGNKENLVSDQCRYSKSIFFATCTRLNKLNFFNIEIFGRNLGVFQNDVEAKPLDKKF